MLPTSPAKKAQEDDVYFNSPIHLAQKSTMAKLESCSKSRSTSPAGLSNNVERGIKLLLSRQVIHENLVSCAVNILAPFPRGRGWDLSKLVYAHCQVCTVWTHLMHSLAPLEI